MSLMSPDQFRESLRDGRTVYYKGKRVDDVTTEPEMKIGVDNAATDYETAQDPKHRDLAVVKDPTTGDEYNAFYKIPRNADDLLARSRLIEYGTEVGNTIPPLLKEIGTDALFAMLRKLEGESLERVQTFYQHCRDNDLGVAVAQTDAKGDRSKSPSRPTPTTTSTSSTRTTRASWCEAPSSTPRQAPTRTSSSRCRCVQ